MAAHRFRFNSPQEDDKASDRSYTSTPSAPKKFLLCLWFLLLLLLLMSLLLLFAVDVFFS